MTWTPLDWIGAVVGGIACMVMGYYGIPFYGNREDRRARHRRKHPYRHFPEYTDEQLLEARINSAEEVHRMFAKGRDMRARQIRERVKDADKELQYRGIPVPVSTTLDHTQKDVAP